LAILQVTFASGHNAFCESRSIAIPALVPYSTVPADQYGFPFVKIALGGRDDVFAATRLDPEHPWVQWAASSIRRTTNQRLAVLPNLGGSLPNDIFAVGGLDLPTIWVPHSYPGCSQHAPNEHLPMAIAREGLAIMAGLYWDLGESGTPVAG
jgi:hypothetical protein